MNAVGEGPWSAPARSNTRDGAAAARLAELTHVGARDAQLRWPPPATRAAAAAAAATAPRFEVGMIEAGAVAAGAGDCGGGRRRRRRDGRGG